MTIQPPDVDQYLNYDGAREIRMRPWSDYTRSIDFRIGNEKVTLTFSIRQDGGTNGIEHQGAYILGNLNSFVKLRNNKTHSGTVEWGDSAKVYAPLLAIVYAGFFKYIGLPDEIIIRTLLQIF